MSVGKRWRLIAVYFHLLFTRSLLESASSDLEFASHKHMTLFLVSRRDLILMTPGKRFRILYYIIA